MAEEDILEAFSRGQAGFSADYAAASASSLIQLLVPEHLSRTWIVVLLSQRYSRDGTLPLATAVPPDNQVDTSFATPATPYNVQGAFVVVEFGNAGVLETVFVDYPFGGGSFVLNAGQVKVSCPTPRGLLAGAAVPRYGAYISECTFRDGSTVNPPTLTTIPQVIPGGGGLVNFQVPPRAIGYRLYNGNTSAPATTLSVFQNAFVGGNPVQFTMDSNVDSVNGNAGMQSLYGAAAVTIGADSFRPLHPAATSISLSSNTAVAVNMLVQWILDLG